MFIVSAFLFIVSMLFFLSAHNFDKKYHWKVDYSDSEKQQFEAAISSCNRFGKLFIVIAVVFFCFATFNAALEKPDKFAAASAPLHSAREDPPSLLKINPTLNIKWDEVTSEWASEITNPEFFSYVKDAYASIEEDRFVLMAVVGDATDPQVALELADTMIRRFNAVATLQKDSIAPSSKDYYGGLYDQYGVMIGVAPYSQIDNKDRWFVSQFILPGMHTKQAPRLQKAYQ